MIRRFCDKCGEPADDTKYPSMDIVKNKQSPRVEARFSSHQGPRKVDGQEEDMDFCQKCVTHFCEQLVAYSRDAEKATQEPVGAHETAAFIL